MNVRCQCGRLFARKTTEELLCPTCQGEAELAKAKERTRLADAARSSLDVHGTAGRIEAVPPDSVLPGVMLTIPFDELERIQDELALLVARHNREGQALDALAKRVDALVASVKIEPIGKGS